MKKTEKQLNMVKNYEDFMKIANKLNVFEDDFYSIINKKDNGYVEISLVQCKLDEINRDLYDNNYDNVYEMVEENQETLCLFEILENVYNELNDYVANTLNETYFILQEKEMLEKLDVKFNEFIEYFKDIF